MMPYAVLALLVILGMLALVIILAVLVFVFARRQGSAAGRSALDVLNERYAKGEITKEEYDQMRRDIAA